MPDDLDTQTQLEASCRMEWERIQLPQRSTAGAAGYDFYLPVPICVDENPMVIQTGIRCEMDPGWVLLLFPRSGLGYKCGFSLSNTVGVIDEDYQYAANEGHISAKVYAADQPISLRAGDRFMQGVFLPYGTALNGNNGGQRKGGTGSTGLR